MAKEPSFLAMKKQRKAAFETLTNEINKMNQGAGPEDAHEYWSPTLDKAGNGFAIIRFLPAAPGEDVPYVRLWTHQFKGPSGQWLIENSLTTIGQKCPISEMNQELWATGVEETRKWVSFNSKRKLNFISNILVVKDPAKPENNGKVFKFKYGQKIFNKIQDKLFPNEDEMSINPDLKPLNVFDLWEGANFTLRVTRQDKYPNYDKSEFNAPSAVSDSDEELEKIWKSQFPLKPLIAPDKFKSYDELKARLDLVMKKPAGAAADASFAKNAKPKPTKTAEDVEEESLPDAPEGDDEKDPIAFFAKLSKEIGDE